MSWSKLAPFGGQPDWVAVRVSYGFDPAGKFFFTGIFSRVTCLQSCRQQFHHFSLSPGSFIFSWRFYFKKRLRNIYPSPFYSPSHLFYFSCPHLPFPTPNLAMIIAVCIQGCFTWKTWHWVKWKWSRSVEPDSLRPHGLYSTRLLRPSCFPGKGTGVGCHFLLQENLFSKSVSVSCSSCCSLQPPKL